MKIEVNITKRRFFFVILSVFVLAGAIFVYAYKNDFSGTVSSAQNFGHSADETVVNISGQLMTLQQAINGNVIGGGSGLETIVVITTTCGSSTSPECPADYPVKVYSSSGIYISEDGCGSSRYLEYSVCASNRQITPSSGISCTWDGEKQFNGEGDECGGGEDDLILNCSSGKLVGARTNC